MKSHEYSKGTEWLWALVLFLFTWNLSAADYTIYYDKGNSKLKTLEFGVSDLESALKNDKHNVTVKDIGELSGSPSNAFIFTFKNNAAKETYEIDVNGSRYESEGSRVGLMYAALELAESINNGDLGKVSSGKRSPHLEKRGLKLNIPLDARTPSYADFGTAAQENIAEMWSMDFWKEQLDSMARNRYNCYTLWNLHPFPSLVKVKDYPNVALDDVKRSNIDLIDKNEGYNTKGLDMVDEDVLGNLQTIKKISIEDKIKFWQEVMQYGHDRGIEFHIYTWNCFVWGAGGKDGIITNEELVDYRDNWGGFRGKDDYDVLVDYFYKSTLALFETYPLLAGIGVTAGEGFGDATSKEEEDFLASTYGQATLDFIQENPSRTVTFVHRAHQADENDILSRFGDLIEEDRIIFDYSLKYANARLYSFAGDDQDRRGLEKDAEDVPSPGKWWLNLRNDDIFNFRWGNYDYVKTYINHLEPFDLIRGFHMGPDGYVMGREFADKDPDSKRKIEHEKHWLKFMLWGRMGFDPNTPESIFADEAKRRLGGSNTSLLMNTWKKASLIIPAANRFRYTPLDFQFHPEYNIDRKSNKGWEDLGYWEAKDGGDDKYDETSTEILESAENVLDALPTLRAAGNGKEYLKTLNDLECFAHLGNFYGNRILATHFLDKNNHSKAEEHTLKASAAWKKYANLASSLYTDQVLARVLYANWEDLNEDAIKDLNDVNGGNPSDLNSLPEVTITSPLNNPTFLTSFLFPIKVGAGSTVQVNASDPDGSVQKVELLIFNEVVGTDTKSPYNFELPELEDGVYLIQARATDNEGATRTEYIHITIGDIKVELESLPWIEDFDLADGSRSDDDKTSWTTSPSSGEFEVSGKKFLVSDTSSILTSGVIDISGTEAFVSLDLESDGSLENGEDFVKLFASIDGGAFELIGEKSGQQGPTTIDGFIKSGDRLVLRIEAATSSSKEKYLLDNLLVIGEKVDDDDNPPTGSLEAESTTFIKGDVKSDSEASGGQYVDGRGGFAISWSVDANGGSEDLTFRVRIPKNQSRSMGVFVNEVKVGILTYDSTEWTDLTISAELINGSNLIELRDTEASAEFDVDYLSLGSGSSTTLEAESADISKGTIKTHADASGGEYVDGAGGFVISWTVDSNGGSKELVFGVRIPKNQSRTMGVFVNGSRIGALTYNSTDWTELRISADLDSGSNTIELRDSESSSEFDVDYLRIK